MNKEQIQQRLRDLLSSKIPLILGENGTSFLGPSWIKTELVLEILKDAFNLGIDVAIDNVYVVTGGQDTWIEIEDAVKLKING